MRSQWQHMLSLSILIWYFFSTLFPSPLPSVRYFFSPSPCSPCIKTQEILFLIYDLLLNIFLSQRFNDPSPSVQAVCVYICTYSTYMLQYSKGEEKRRISRMDANTPYDHTYTEKVFFSYITYFVSTILANELLLLLFSKGPNAD